MKEEKSLFIDIKEKIDLFSSLSIKNENELNKTLLPTGTFILEIGKNVLDERIKNSFVCLIFLFLEKIKVLKKKSLIREKLLFLEINVSILLFKYETNPNNYFKVFLDENGVFSSMEKENKTHIRKILKEIFLNKRINIPISFLKKIIKISDNVECLKELIYLVCLIIKEKEKEKSLDNQILFEIVKLFEYNQMKKELITWKPFYLFLKGIFYYSTQYKNIFSLKYCLQTFSLCQVYQRIERLFYWIKTRDETEIKIEKETKGIFCSKEERWLEYFNMFQKEKQSVHIIIQTISFLLYTQENRICCVNIKENTMIRIKYLTLSRTRGEIKKLKEKDPEICSNIEKIFKTISNQKYVDDQDKSFIYWIAKEMKEETNLLQAKNMILFLLNQKTKNISLNSKIEFYYEVCLELNLCLEFCIKTVFLFNKEKTASHFWIKSLLNCNENEIKEILKLLSIEQTISLFDFLIKIEDEKILLIISLIEKKETEYSTLELLQCGMEKLLNGQSLDQLKILFKKKTENFFIHLLLGCFEFYSNRNMYDHVKRALCFPLETDLKKIHKDIFDLTQACLGLSGEKTLRLSILEKAPCFNSRMCAVLKTEGIKCLNRKKKEDIYEICFLIENKQELFKAIKELKIQPTKNTFLGLSYLFYLLSLENNSLLQKTLLLMNSLSIIEKINQKQIKEHEKKLSSEITRLSCFSLLFDVLLSLENVFYLTGQKKASFLYIKKGISLAEPFYLQKKRFELERKKIEFLADIKTEASFSIKNISERQRSTFMFILENKELFLEAKYFLKEEKIKEAENLCVLFEKRINPKKCQDLVCLKAELLIKKGFIKEAENLLNNFEQKEKEQENFLFEEYLKALCFCLQNKQKEKGKEISKNIIEHSLKKGPFYFAKKATLLYHQKNFNTQMESSFFEISRNPSLFFDKKLIQAHRDLALNKTNPINLYPLLKGILEYPLEEQKTQTGFSYLKENLPQNWDVLSIDYDLERKLFFITKLSSELNERQSFSFYFHSQTDGQCLLLEFEELIKESQQMLRQKNISSRKLWWEKRYLLDENLCKITKQFEKDIFWFGKLLKCCPERESVLKLKKKLSLSGFEIEEWTAELLLRGKLIECEKTLRLLCQTLIKQKKNTHNSFDETKLFDLVNKFIKTSPTNIFEDEITYILVLGKELCSFCWESLPCFSSSPITRVPNLSFLVSLLKKQNVLSIEKTSYLLNPENDLKNTQIHFEEMLNKNNWRGIVGRKPSEKEFEELLDKEIFLYFGHGGGEKYIRATSIKKRRKTAAALLLGCSSGKLDCPGLFDCSGTAYNYLIGGSPSVLATLWDVTDKDIDRFTSSLIEEWFYKKKSLAKAVVIARKKCILSFIIGAASVIYGIPTFVKQNLT